MRRLRGMCYRLPAEAPEFGWEPGDVVTYRCRDCTDVWYVEVVKEDLDGEAQDQAT